MCRTAANVAAFQKMAAAPGGQRCCKLHVVPVGARHACPGGRRDGSASDRRARAGRPARLASGGCCHADHRVAPGFYSWQLWDCFAATRPRRAGGVGAAVSLPLVRRLPDGSCTSAPDLLIPHCGQAPGSPCGRRTAPGSIDEDQARIVRAQAGVHRPRPRRRLQRAHLRDHQPPGPRPADRGRDGVHPSTATLARIRADETKTDPRSAGAILRSTSPDLAEHGDGSQSCWPTTRSGS